MVCKFRYFRLYEIRRKIFSNIARKWGLQKSKCKENEGKSDSPHLLNSLFTPSRLPRFAGESNPRGGRYKITIWLICLSAWKELMTLMDFINGINDKNKWYSQMGSIERNWYLWTHKLWEWVICHNYEKEFKLPNKTVDLFGSQKENQ